MLVFSMSKVQELLAALTSGEDERAEAAAAALAKHGAAAVDGLESLLASNPEVDSRWWAVRALAEMEDARIPALLTRALQDPAPEVRQCAALGLRTRPEPNSIPALIAGLSDLDPLAASLAADTLVAIGAPSVPDLIEVLSGERGAVRLLAVRALAQIGDPRAIPALMAALQTDSALMEYWANEGLDRMGLGWQFFQP